MNKRLFSALLLVSILFVPFKSYALDIGLPFGGLVTAAVPCTCSTGVWIGYSILYLGAPTPVVGSLWFPPMAKLYAWFQLGVPGTWNLGSYVPGVGGCWILAPNPSDPCLPLTAGGTIEYMGTSKLF
jgi:hypothetical protein